MLLFIILIIIYSIPIILLSISIFPFFVVAANTEANMSLDDLLQTVKWHKLSLL